MSRVDQKFTALLKDQTVFCPLGFDRYHSIAESQKPRGSNTNCSTEKMYATSERKAAVVSKTGQSAVDVSAVISHVPCDKNEPRVFNATERCI